MSRLINWLAGGGLILLGGFLGFVISQSLAFYTFTKNLETTKKIEMIHLARDLTHDFYPHGTDTNPVFRDVRMAIEKCKKLYKGYDKEGSFDYEQINSYLGFFDDLGFYYKKRALDLETVKQLFGAYVIEAHENNELQRYINDLRKNYKQPRAFVNFQALAQKLKEIPEYKELIKTSRLGCPDKGK
jgi:hypothetical protein